MKVRSVLAGMAGGICRGGHVEFTVRKHDRINAGVPFVLFVQSGTPSHGMVQLTLRVDLLTLINFI